MMLSKWWILPLLLGCLLSGCVQSGTILKADLTVVQEEETDLPEEDVTTVDTSLSEQDLNESRNTLEDWLGKYTWGEHWGPGEDVSVDTMIYRDGSQYYAYVEGNGLGMIARYTATVKLEAGIVSFYFLESTTPIYYREGDLLFTLWEEDDRLLVQWGVMQPTSYYSELGENRAEVYQMEKWGDFGAVWNDHQYITFGEKEGFLDSHRGKISPEYWSEMREYYSETVFKELLDSYETGNEEKIHYQDYNEDGALILDFYYDTLLCQGAGLDGALEYEEAKEIYAFSLRGYKRQRWENEAFSIPELDRIKENALEAGYYEEYWEYNEAGDPVCFRAEGYDERFGKEDREIKPLISVDFTYRPDGTLMEKECMGAYVMYIVCRYDEQERLITKTVDVNHGARCYYYIYPIDRENSLTPSWCLMVDRGWEADMIRFVE